MQDESGDTGDGFGVGSGGADTDSYKDIFTDK
jgi:hypothetical protein